MGKRKNHENSSSGSSSCNYYHCTNSDSDVLSDLSGDFCEKKVKSSTVIDELLAVNSTDNNNTKLGGSFFNNYHFERSEEIKLHFSQLSSISCSFNITDDDDEEDDLSAHSGFAPKTPRENSKSPPEEIGSNKLLTPDEGQLIRQYTDELIEGYSSEETNYEYSGLSSEKYTESENSLEKLFKNSSFNICYEEKSKVDVEEDFSCSEELTYEYSSLRVDKDLLNPVDLNHTKLNKFKRAEEVPEKKTASTSLNYEYLTQFLHHELNQTGDIFVNSLSPLEEFNDRNDDILLENCIKFPPPPVLSSQFEEFAIDPDQTVLIGSKDLSGADQRLRTGFDFIIKDSSLLHAGPILENVEDIKRTILNKIDTKIKWVIEGFSGKHELFFKIKNNKRWDNCIFEDGIMKRKSSEDVLMRTVKFNRAGSRHRFNLMFYLLCKCYSLLKNNSVCTQREMYYQLKKLVTNETQIQKAMMDISSMLNIAPFYLPIVSVSKGLVFGNLKVIISEEEVVYCSAFGGTLIPQNISKIREFESDACFILVVEKDAIFKKLLDEDITSKLSRPFILITTMAHLSEQLAVPGIRWLGILPEEIKSLNITSQPLTDNERAKIERMLKRPYVDLNPWLKDALETLQEINCKAEIEGIIKSSSFLTDAYLPNKFFSRNYY